MEINKQKKEISQVLVDVKENKNEMDFLIDRGSKNELFIFLRQQISNIYNAEVKIGQIVSNSQEIDITFDERKVAKIESLGSLLEYTQPCQVQYKPHKFLQAQMEAEGMKRIVGFEKDTELNLKTGIKYNPTDVSITNDNKLLLTNNWYLEPKLYVYRDCKDYETEIRFHSKPFGVTAIPSTDRAVVTLPYDKSLQFINTTKMTMDNTVNVGFNCYGITSGNDRIYVGGKGGRIKTLDTKGTILKSFQHGSEEICFMAYDKSNERLSVIYTRKLICINSNGKLVFSKNISGGTGGITLDRQGNIYIGGYNTNILRISSDWETCEEMLKEDQKNIHPYGICFNNDFTKLFALNNGATSVSVYKCK